MAEMRLNTGLVIVGAYADKVRRTLFAQLKDKIKAKEIDSKMVAKAAGDLNKLLYEIFVNRLKLDKGDVVRIVVDYDVRDGEVVWDLDSLKIEVFKRIPEEEYAEIVRESVKRIEELEEVEEVRMRIERVGKTDLGDVVYEVRVGDEKVGALVLTPLNGEGIVRGALLRPNPVIIERVKVSMENLEEELLKVVEEKGRVTEEEEARRIIEDIERMKA
ncbi:DUF2258 domain-containing protein [Archaeoglobus profundus]|uniref:Thermo-DBP-RP2-like C-terminal domain-containing protein n=1 Tax=Archaeoglobus profundus (strain DSM 5631 / JCM 9629 / NBRC 100127 / Av18) TaxID=572546 RepID=D2RFH9_ARCPA|nr:DUF2258 domain-containing protein [Archaeoglobus profundus]ADB58873.1 hypothetical protein Arcpr_1830 [Archaeoglobus profundus DSM 5631]